LIQSDGQVAWQWAYSAFGDEKPTIAKNRFANTDLNQSFGTTSVPAVTFNLRYPGQYFDQESGLHYNYHRSYSATTGRYTQADPIGLDGGWNRFGYAEQNPLSFSDVLGLTSIPYPVSPGISIPSIKPSPWMIPLIPLIIPGDTQRKCICRPATVENIRSVLNSSPMLSFQPSVSASHTQSMVTALDSGAVLPAIWVDGNAIVDGNHRYIAGILCNTPTALQPWQAPLTKRPIPFPLLKIVD
jgi:RHS repeat-associated protein